MLENVCKPNKALYGLKQAPHIWYNTLATSFPQMGYNPLSSDSGIFTNGNTLVAVYIDDLRYMAENTRNKLLDGQKVADL